MMKGSEKGFGGVEIIMAVVIVVLLGAVVYLFVQANQKSDQGGQDAKTSASASPTPSPEPAASEKPAVSMDVASVKTMVTNFYSEYAKATDSSAVDAIVARYGTARFIAAYNGIMHGSQGVAGDPVMCVNGMVSGTPTVADVKLAPTGMSATATVKVASSVMPVVTVANDNGLKIDAVSCTANE